MTVQVQGPDGTLVEFPDGTPPDEMTRALRAHYGPPTAPAAPVTPGGVPIGASGLPRVEIGAPPPPAPAVNPNADKGLLHNFAVGAQGVDAGLRDIVLSPFDLAAGAQNLATGVVNKVFDTEIPSATPASRIAEQVAGPFSIPEAEMSPKEKQAYNVNRFGTQAIGTGAALSTRAPAILEAASTGAKPAGDLANRTLDTLARPYQAAPARTVVGDAVGGAGAGVAVNAADDYLPKEPATPLG
ncbi:hypothetical protein ASC80_05505 [Afipia sp. Root123D2]|uniref:hypothetical protein n=1 Tax=Afipia sp. Root123D2 TaxID=1736436 RepID=UPI0006F4D0C7|nr:hypothetical protein [Afipia sp. Root123D2]KQW22796.1 hypothetical protein ASC80_05505 [Afipia sp. Root123D2]